MYPGWSGNSTELLVHGRQHFFLMRKAQFRSRYFSGILDHRERQWHLSLQRILHAHYRDFRDVGVRLYGFLDLACAEPVSGDVDDVIRSSQNEVIAVFVADTPVERGVNQFL